MFHFFFFIIYFYFRFINVKNGSEIATILLHEGDDIKNLDKIKSKIAYTFSVNEKSMKLMQTNGFVVMQPKE